MKLALQTMTSANTLPRSSPEAEGVSSARLLAFLEAVDETIRDLHSFMLLRHGRVIAEGWWSPYAPEYPHSLFSLSKAFTSTAIGLAVAEGLLSIDDFVLSLLADAAPADVSEKLAALRVRHLLTMSSGHDPSTGRMMFAQPEGNWGKGYLSQPMTDVPGTQFYYEDGAAYALSAIVQRVTGMTTLQYLQPRLFEPLGIRNVAWTMCPYGNNTGFTGLSLTTEEVAQFGQLYLQKGMWHGKRILPKAWVEEATRSHIATGGDDVSDPDHGFGYMFSQRRHGEYDGEGAFGQFCVVMADQDAVLVTTGGKEGMNVILELFWQYGLSAMTTTALPENRETQGMLSKKLATLSMAPASGQSISPIATKASRRTYTFTAHDQPAKTLSFDFGNGPFEVTVESISFDFDNDGCVCTIQDDRNTHQVACGNGQWRKGVTTLNSIDGYTSQPVGASGAWVADDTYELKFCFVETAFRSTLTCHFVEDTITMDWHENARFVDWQVAQLKGWANR